MKAFFMFILTSSFYLQCQSQQISSSVINCAGNSFSNSSSRLVFNIGEVVVTKIGNSSNSITQGFLQPNILASGVNEIETSYKFVVYPNPAYGDVKIESEDYKEPITIKLIDGMGRELYSGLLVNNTLSLDPFQNGMYQLLIYNSNHELIQRKSITKIN